MSLHGNVASLLGDPGIGELTALVDYTDLAPLAGGVTLAGFSFDAPIPAGARFAALIFEDVAPFDDGIGGRVLASVRTDVDDLVLWQETNVDVTYSANDHGVLAPVFPGIKLPSGGVKLYLRSIDGDLNQIVGGDITAVLLYYKG